MRGKFVEILQKRILRTILICFLQKHIKLLLFYNLFRQSVMSELARQ